MNKTFRKNASELTSSQQFGANSYQPLPFPFKNGHFHTVWAAKLRRLPKPAYQRSRLWLSDGDFLDLDWVKNGRSKLLILVHGLEGSSQSSYIRSVAARFSKAVDICAVNLRSCSGSLNLAPRLYHHGATDDMDELVRHAVGCYQEVFLMGFSLGGNLVLKYLGESQWNHPQQLISGMAVSAPIHLKSCVAVIHQPAQRLYHDMFLRELKVKVAQKSRQYPEIFNAGLLPQTKTLRDFDNHFTAPVFGFENGEDYYEKASSLPYLKTLQRPALLLQSMDDPMLDKPCFPYDLATPGGVFRLKVTRYGGHTGFLQKGTEKTYYEALASGFFGLR
jgi:predicted alpha/beta-fold hydrolase